MPDGKVAVCGEGEHEEFAVGRYAGERDAFSCPACIVKRVCLAAERTGVCIKADGTQAVLHLVVFSGYAHAVRGTEIERSSIGRESGECLKGSGRGQKWGADNLLPFHVVNHDIGGIIHDFHAVRVGGMEHLLGIVHRECHKIAGGMPRRVDQCRNGLRCFRIQFLYLSFLYDVGPSVVGTEVEQHFLRVLPAEGMAVHAAVAGHLVGEDGCFLIVFQTTLVDAHLVPGLVARFYQPVGDVGVYLLFGDVEVERGVFFPFVSSLGLQADGDGRCGVYEPFPFGGTDGYLPVAGCDGSFFIACPVYGPETGGMAAVRQGEAWGSHVRGKRDFGIIGRYGRPVTGMAVDMYVL